MQRDQLGPESAALLSTSRRRLLALACTSLIALPAWARAARAAPTRFNVRDFGALGDGTALDGAAINRAIEAAANAGGGCVEIPAGRYLSFTVHLRSHVELHFSAGAVLIAATPDFARSDRRYDAPEAQPESIRAFQDHGHNHWHNSLIYGENLENVALTGRGELWGRGLQKGDGAAEEQAGAGNKIIALKNCRNVVLRDLSLRDAGHFGVLASGVDSLSIDNLRIDTRRDGIDIDACRDVHIRACTVNAPWDDAIVLKASYSLGALRHTERVTISDCIISGCFEAGSVLDGSYRHFPEHVAEDPPSTVGRIKIGTETNGDVRGVVVSNCLLQGCHGLAVESEDGGHVEDISFSNIVMRDLVGPPIFVRLGGRLRGPAGTQVGTIRRVLFRDIDCAHASGQVASIIAGLPAHPVEDVRIDGLRVVYSGGGSARLDVVPERVTDYPDPEMFGNTPAQAMYVRHAERIELRDLRLRAEAPDARPLLWFDDVHDARVDDVVVQGAQSERLRMQASSAISVDGVAQ